jgi:uncharacterized protein (TIGR00369 family)
MRPTGHAGPGETPPQDSDVLTAVRQFLPLIPFNQFLGIETLDVQTGLVRMRLPYRPVLVGNPVLPALHGGVLSTLLDVVGGGAAWTVVRPGERVYTIDLRIDYLEPARCLTLLAEAKVVRSGRRIVVVNMRAFHEEQPSHTLADARGVFGVGSGGLPGTHVIPPSTE